MDGYRTVKTENGFQLQKRLHNEWPYCFWQTVDKDGKGIGGDEPKTFSSKKVMAQWIKRDRAKRKALLLSRGKATIYDDR
jgi:hypothetical protein